MNKPDNNTSVVDPKPVQPPQYRETFFIVPRDILELPGMTFSYLKVFEVIFQFWNKGRKVYVGETSFCDRTGISRRQLYNALEYFEKHKKIVRTLVNGRRIVSQPEMTIEIESDDPCTPVHDPVQSSAPTPCTPVHVEIKKGNKETNIKEKIYKKEKETSPALREREYKETLYEVSETKKPNKGALSLSELCDTNPHNIPADMIMDWVAVRHDKKAKITPTAWKRLNNQLAKCPDPLEAFEVMVSGAWLSLNPSWIENATKDKKKESHFDHNDTSWANEENKGMFD